MAENDTPDERDGEEADSRASVDYEYDDLKHMTVAELRDVAGETDAVQGYTQMRKEDLLHALCEAFGIEEHVHYEVVGMSARRKSRIRKRIRELKAERDEILEQDEKDYDELKRIRTEIKGLKRQIRRATV